MEYYFRCNNCGRVFNSNITIKQLEILRELGYNDYVKCPDCGNRDVTKLILDTTVIFKGDGFTKSVKNNDVE